MLDLDPTKLEDRQTAADSLFKAIPDLTPAQKARVQAWVSRSWDPRDDEPGVPKSDVIFHGTRQKAVFNADTPEDALVEGEGVADRVRLRRAAKAGGYKKPWGRGAGF